MMLEDQISIVTGAASGIGRAICQLFSKEGAKIIAVDINEEGAKETLTLCDGEGHASFKVDVSNSEEVRALISTVVKTRGSPSILVNCAGIIILGDLLDITEDQYNKMMDVNLKGSFLLTQEVCKAMKAEGIRRGSIINFSSLAGKMAANGFGVYGMSKAAVLALTRSTAHEMATFNIRCNALCPGAVDTPMLHSLFPESVNVLEFVKSQNPLKKVGSAEEIAELCLFLASEKGSYMTGAALDVNGGTLMC